MAALAVGENFACDGVDQIFIADPFNGQMDIVAGMFFAADHMGVDIFGIFHPGMIQGDFLGFFRRFFSLSPEAWFLSSKGFAPDSYSM